MEEAFQAALRELNPAQKQAVEAIDGPVLVVAGPGTGKTQLLSLRVANILHQTDTDPGSILCLTFTNFAATNMRERLTKLVGPAARNVMVRTFHSFAAEIMNLYPDYFWNGARLSIAPDAVQLEIIQNILAGLSLDNPLALKFAGTYTALGDVQQALKLTKEAGLTPDKLEAMLAVNAAYIDQIEPLLVEILAPTLSAKKLDSLKAAINDLPDQPIDENVQPLSSLSTVLKESLAAAIAEDEASGKTTQTGKWKRRWLQTVSGEKGMFDERRRNAWWIAVADVYRQYREALHERGYYDYSDMIIEVISQLEQNPELLASVQERFLYVLIDEFQDTNAAQLRLAHLVATHFSAEGKPNLMAVGDDDQTIFAFNGAELNNMLAFRRSYPTTQTIVLTENYRSTQAILDTASAVIEQADDRLVKRESSLTKHLKAVRDLAPGTIEHISYPTQAHQLSAIGQRIQQQWSNSDGSIAVLARSHDSLKRISTILSRLNVPLRYEQQNNILQQEIVVQICNLAEIIAAVGSGDAARVNHILPVTLRHPMWELSKQTLWELAEANYRRPDWLTSLTEHAEEHVNAIGLWVLWLAQEASKEPLTVILEYLIGLRAGLHLTSPVREYFLALKSVDNTYLEGLSALQVLQGLAREFASGELATLENFVSLIRLNRSLGRTITDQSWFMSGERAVEVMTVHKAKGLEFDTVFLLDAIEDVWQPRHMGRKPPANLPLQPYGEEYDDYIRLLYVAVTRAKQSFIASSYYTDNQGRELLPTPLLAEALPLTRVTAETAEEPIIVLETAMQWPRLETRDEKALLRDRLDNYRLSATALLQFLDISTGGPQHFFERHLLRLPEAPTANMAYGTAVHAALQTAQLLVNRKKFTLSAVTESYRDTLAEQPITLAEQQRYEPHGKQILTKLFEDRGFTLKPGGLPEVAISNVEIGPASIGGKLDHVLVDDKQLFITDYKTGKPLSSFETRDQTKVIKAWRHRTQLLFYCLLASHDPRFKDVKAVHGQMVYVEAEQTRELILTMTPSVEDLKTLERLITIVWSHIMELNFPDSTGYEPGLAGITAFSDDLLHGRI